MKLKAELTGVGLVNNAQLYLEDLPSINNLNAVPVPLYPADFQRKKWSNDEFEITVVGNLEYYIKVHALKGTKWAIKLTNLETQKVILELDCKTGENSSYPLNISVKIGMIAI